MPNENFTEPPEDDKWCGDEIKSNPGHYCSNEAKYSDGKCGEHSDEHERNSKGGEWKHGAYARRSTYYEKLPDEEKEFVDAVYWSFLDDAPFDEESRGKCEMLWNVAVDIHKQRRVNDYIEGKGMVQDKVAGAGESGPYYDEEENVLHLTYDRLSRSNIKTLKELGVLEPEKSKSEAREAFVDLFSE